MEVSKKRVATLHFSKSGHGPDQFVKFWSSQSSDLCRGHATVNSPADPEGDWFVIKKRFRDTTDYDHTRVHLEAFVSDTGEGRMKTRSWRDAPWVSN